MEIHLEVTQSTEEIRDSSYSVALTANFTFVARDSRTGKPAPIKPISPEIKREKLLWQEAEKKESNEEKGEKNVAAILRGITCQGSKLCLLKFVSSVICLHWQTVISFREATLVLRTH
ncbi:hypothetical protein EUGRSUZ_H01860 [Eucalyptus grandis]|uniref:Uncharacterized protein n=2 Tax=Eucalyptus grandis TaxID=71139 RepID=A0ACC3LZG8_EUCGR|nr:hypothetical protein EUGRSUZ_H01860 [Eucalyptus grandis]